VHESAEGFSSADPVPGDVNLRSPGGSLSRCGLVVHMMHWSAQAAVRASPPLRFHDTDKPVTNL
jgi:hypothetical protein